MATKKTRAYYTISPAVYREFEEKVKMVHKGSFFFTQYSLAIKMARGVIVIETKGKK